MLTTHEVAKILNCDESNVRRLISTGKIRAKRFGKRAHAIPEKEARRYKREQELRRLGKQPALF